jgi:multicomponent Na+:H+ antiporter subunit D
MFVIAALGLAELPPFGTALGKTVTERGLEQSGQGPWVPGLFLVVSTVTGAAVLRAGLRVYFGLGVAPDTSGSKEITTGKNEKRETNRPIRRPPFTMLLAPGLLIAAIAVVGVLPQAGQIAGRAGADATDSSGRQHDVLPAVPAGPAEVPAVVEWTCADAACVRARCATERSGITRSRDHRQKRRQRRRRARPGRTTRGSPFYRR